MNYNSKLVDAKGLLEALFPEDCRPTVRWVREQQRRKTLPFIKLGHLVFFNLEEVQEAIAARHTIRARGLAPYGLTKGLNINLQ